MIGQIQDRASHYLILGGMCLFLFFVNLGEPTLWDVDEGKNATCALEMMRSNNWVIPTFNGKLRVDKPALLYWLQIMSFQYLGISEFAARFPSALAALIVVFVCYELARSMFTRGTALLAAVVVASTPMLCGAARFANPDSLLNACTVISLALFWAGAAKQPWWWFPAIGASAGLGMLAKGPIGWLLPAAVIFLFLLWERQCRLYLDRRWLITCATFTLVGLPWYIWVGVDTRGEFLKGFLWTHNLERGLTAMNEHHGFPGYYVVVVFAGTAPWSIFLFVSWWYGFWSAIRCPFGRWSRWWMQAAENQAGACGMQSHAPPPDSVKTDRPAAYRFLTCWIFVYLAFYSAAATKLPNYALPVVVPCAILIARFAQRWQATAACAEETAQPLAVPGWLTGSGLIGLGVFGAALSVGLAFVSGVVDLPQLHGRTVEELGPWTPIGLVPVAAAVVGGRLAWKKRHRGFVWTIAGCALLLTGPLVACASVVFNQHKAPAPLVEQTRVFRQTEDIRIAAFQLEYLPSLSFYVQRNVTYLENGAEVRAMLTYPVPVYVFMPIKDWERDEAMFRDVGHVVARHREMYQHDDIVVVTNRTTDRWAGGPPPPR